MVTAPKCKVCGVAHFGSAHVWPGASAPKVPTVPSIAKPALSRVDDRDKTITALRAEVADLKAKLASMDPKPKFDRAAYMRGYRARKKVER